MPPLQADLSHRSTSMLNTTRARDVHEGLPEISGNPASEAVIVARPQNIWSSLP